MGCSLVSAITFMNNKSRNVCVFYFGCILVRFGRVSSRTDGTRSWEPQGLPKASGQALKSTFHHPSRKEGSLSCICWPHSYCYYKGFIWLPLLAGQVTVLCSVYRMLELPGPVLLSCSLSIRHLCLLNSIKLLSAHFHNLSRYYSSGFHNSLLHQTSLTYQECISLSKSLLKC